MSTNRRFALFISGLLLLFFPEFGQAIMNGELVGAGEFPALSTVLVIQTVQTKFGAGYASCSGTLISPDLILTAGHCALNPRTLKKADASDLAVYFGNFEGTWTPELLRQVSDFRQQKDFKMAAEGFRNDVAILKLKTVAPPQFKPVRVLRNLKNLKKDARVLIAGFGIALTPKDPQESKFHTLRSFQTRIFDSRSQKYPGTIVLYTPRQLNEKFGIAYPSTPGHPELFGEGGMAEGDSGGPLFLKIEDQLFVAGAASGYREDGPHYSSTPYFSDWIDKTMLELETSAR